MLDERALEAALAGRDPASADRLRMYISEARFFAEVIKADLRGLAPSASVLEVGSGVGMLALMTADLGLRITAVEPESRGFGEMLELRTVLRSCWDGPVPEVDWVAGFVADEMPNAVATAGFADQAHFTRAFGAAFGLPPARWRALHRR